MKISNFLILVIFAGLCYSASVSKRDQILEIRDALNNMLDENDIEMNARSDVNACPFHACTAEILGCDALAVNENGCKLCECAGEETEPQVPCPMHACTAEMLGCNQLAVNENGCELCECSEGEVIQTRADEVANEVADDVSPLEKCVLVQDPGPCKAIQQRYYYNVTEKTCLQFDYGGCKGNENNFETKDECISACQKVMKTRSDEAPESDEKVTKPLTECQKAREAAAAGTFVPECDGDGSYKSVQCYNNECWCVLEHDDEVQGTKVPSSEMTSLICYEGSDAAPKRSSDEYNDDDADDDIIAVRREVEAALEELLN